MLDAEERAGDPFVSDWLIMSFLFRSGAGSWLGSRSEFEFEFESALSEARLVGESSIVPFDSSNVAFFSGRPFFYSFPLYIPSDFKWTSVPETVNFIKVS